MGPLVGVSFISAVRNENAARNLAIFSQLLNVFQSYYHFTVVTYGNRDVLRFHLFNSFLNLLHDGGINEYEDPDQPFPKGHVQVMTIHQAKGLEFDVVFVIMLCDGLFPTERSLDVFESLEEERRLLYVAITRARNELYLCYPLIRSGFGGDNAMQHPSRFLQEIPSELLDEWNLRTHF